VVTGHCLGYDRRRHAPVPIKDDSAVDYITMTLNSDLPAPPFFRPFGTSLVLSSDLRVRRANRAFYQMFRVTPGARGLPATPSGVLAGPVEPEAFQSLLSEHGPDRVDARPILRPSDEPFLAPLGEDVLQALDLGSIFVGHQDRVVSPRPESLAPVGEATGLAGEIGVQVAHEPGELLGVIDGEKQMEVVGKKGEGANSDGVETLRASQDADDEGVELGRRAEKEAPVEGPAGDLHERTALGNEAQSSHSWYRRKTGSEI